MNQFLQNNLFIIIFILLIFILFLMAVIVLVLYRLLAQDRGKLAVEPKNGNTGNNELNISFPDSAPYKTKKEMLLAKHEIVVEKFYCLNHKNEPSGGSCLMCEEVFCENCLVEHEGMFFCREHFKVFANNKWVQITDEKTIPTKPEEGMYIWNFKRDLWKTNATPTFVLTHYKINIDEDFIESYVQLNVREEDSERLKADILTYKAKH